MGPRRGRVRSTIWVLNGQQQSLFMYRQVIYQRVGNYTIGGQPITRGGGSGGMVSGGAVLPGVPLPLAVAVACRVLGLVVAKKVAGLSEMVMASSLGWLGPRLGGTSGLGTVSDWMAPAGFFGHRRGRLLVHQRMASSAWAVAGGVV